MLNLMEDGNTFTVNAGAYSLRTMADRSFVALTAGGTTTQLCALTSAHATRMRDDTSQLGTWQAETSPDGERVVLTLSAASSAWKRKTIRLYCSDQRLLYEVELNGHGHLDEVTLLGGYCSAQQALGTGFFWSGQHFQQGFTPEPHPAGQAFFPASSGASLALGASGLPGKQGGLFTPPPFCLAFQLEQGWLGLGVEAYPGENRFSGFHYHAQPGAFYLTLAYDGRTAVDGDFALPSIGFDFGADPYAVLAAHVKALRTRGLVPLEAVTPRLGWWREPIFFGWGSQCYRAAQNGASAPELSRQDLYGQFMARLERSDVWPGTLVIGDKWQATYADNEADPHKWPDLRGFISSQHSRGRRVLLSLKAWDPEGLPMEETLRNSARLPVAADPTHPAYIARLRHAVRRMISAHGYDADGFEIDFGARIPNGPGLQPDGDAWGLELMKAYLGMLYREAKAVKPDALIVAQASHPYLVDVIDMVRLNSPSPAPDPAQEITRRVRVAALALPQALINLDDWPIADRAAWRSFTRLQPELGVPSLYYAEGIDASREPFEEEDYRLVKEVWDHYRKSHNLPA
jgi:hypothetical protein